MSQIVGDLTLVTEDEEFHAESNAAARIERFLESLKLDVYNARYVIQVNVHRVDEAPSLSCDGSPSSDF